jgi:hypothetical protein
MGSGGGLPNNSYKPIKVAESGVKHQQSNHLNHQMVMGAIGVT